MPSHDGTSAPDDRLLSPRTAAEYLDISLGAMRMRIWRKQVPCVRVGGRNFLRYSELMRYIKHAPDRHKSPLPDEVSEEQPT